MSDDTENNNEARYQYLKSLSPDERKSYWEKKGIPIFLIELGETMHMHLESLDQINCKVSEVVTRGEHD